MQVGNWVWNHLNEISGIAFMPHTDHEFSQAPYQEITQEEYEKLEALMPVNVDWTGLSDYEKEDHTTGSKELSCTAGVCELNSIGDV